MNRKPFPYCRPSYARVICWPCSRTYIWDTVHLRTLKLPDNDLQDDGLGYLARKFNLTLEAIALQTRHIVDEMNAKGHSIESIYMSGGQAKNLHLMQLFADTIGIPVVLPENSGAAVVLGAAMLGRMANDAGAVKQGKLSEEEQCEALWKIMVDHFPSYVDNVMYSLAWP